MTLYTPNDAGLPLKITHPDGTSEEFSFSLYGELLRKTQRNGSVVRYSYDDFSRPLEEEIYDRSGKLLKKCTKKYSGLLLESETDGEELEKRYTYDYAGRISEIRQGTLTKYIYDALGRIEEEQHFFGESEHEYIATRFIYDLLNRVKEKWKPMGTVRRTFALKRLMT
ncbi:MAG: hypothetical protein H0W50_03585 [Parachlamydiaceae bacterium]|nr:hypothetical protein [Parachlamydiaceae bacterium]